MKITVRKVLAIAVLILLMLILRPVSFLIYSSFNDQAYVASNHNGFAQDASNLNAVKVDTTIKAAKDLKEATNQIAILISQAKRDGKRISIAGARHTMGGHTIYPNGIVLDMAAFNYMQIDSSGNILTVGSGARWHDVIRYLDGFRKSVAVMQSNNSFSVGGSLSANCHGWQPNSAPMISTVESFRLITTSGDILTCSRKLNQELFSLVAGGYGLFGVILDVRLKVTDNAEYTAKQYVIKSTDYVREFRKHVNSPSIGLAYGRINVNPDRFMEEAILSTYIKTGEEPEILRDGNPLQGFRRTLFRSSANSNYGKNLRWKLEKLSVRLINDKKFSRNRLLNEGVEVFQNTDTAYTDILHEYFIPANNFNSFIAELKQILPKYKTDLMNITVRNVKNDSDSYLAYARGEVFGLVLLFNQKRDTASENEMRLLTRKLIDKALALNGTYYLPYRLHASKEQMYRAYPKAPAFFELKKKYDPDIVFDNEFYEYYKP